MHDVPHGVCIVSNDHTRGVVTFTYGKMHGGPMWLEYQGGGMRESYEYVEEGKCKGV